MTAKRDGGYTQCPQSLELCVDDGLFESNEKECQHQLQMYLIVQYGISETVYNQIALFSLLSQTFRLFWQLGHSRQ